MTSNCRTRSAGLVAAAAIALIVSTLTTTSAAQAEQVETDAEAVAQDVAHQATTNHKHWLPENFKP